MCRRIFRKLLKKTDFPDIKIAIFTCTDRFPKYSAYAIDQTYEESSKVHENQLFA